MKDTPQLQNTEDLLVLYEELTFLVSQLNNDAPKIKKMYTSLEQTIAKQEASATKAAHAIETAASANISRMQKEAKVILDASEQHLAKAEAVAKRCEAALSQIEAVAKNVQSVRQYQLAVEKRLAQFEAKLQNVNSSTQPHATHSATSSTAEIVRKPATLCDYFKQNGIRVIDYRASGGALWVVGSESDLKSHVDYVKAQFNVTGHYGSGRATGNKPGWWTKDSK